MSDSDARPEVSEEVMAEVRALAKDVEELLGENMVMLEGASSVELVVGIEDALTPVEAVEVAIRKIAHVGMDAFTFAVVDEGGNQHFVRAGEIVPIDDLRYAIAPGVESDGQGD